jgi:hypothetical protein
MCLEHHTVENDVNRMFSDLQDRIRIDSIQEKRVNDIDSVDFTDILIDLNTMNPTESEFLKELERKKQL